MKMGATFLTIDLIIDYSIHKKHQINAVQDVCIQKLS